MDSSNNKKILFVCPYPLGGAPGQRFRYEMFLDKLSDAKISYTIAPFLDEMTNEVLFKDGFIFKKVLGVLKGFVLRVLLLFTVIKFDYVYIYREASPIGPPFFEWIAAKILRRRIIFDFDDAIFLSLKSEKNKIINSIKWTSKVKSICRWSHLVNCGNEYLADFAKGYNDNVTVTPTVVDTEMVHNKLKTHSGIATNIGWTGSHSTNYLLELVKPVIQKLQIKYNLSFIVISSARPEIEDLELDFVKWSLDNEIEELFKIDIGIMPLFDDAWTRGKCGFKAIQYTSLGIPAVVSPVGVNSQIIDHGINGYWASEMDEWERYLEKLIIDYSLRNEMGRNGRTKIVAQYSKEASFNHFISLFN